MQPARVPGCRRALWWLVLLGAAGAAAPLPALDWSCHIHPPPREESDPRPPTTIGPFSSETDCQIARRGLFGDLGRCHCIPGFTSRLGSPGRDDRDRRGPLPLDLPLP